MPEYLSPGVYVEEVNSGPKPIEGVATATPAFVGFTAKAERVREVNGEMEREDLLNKPVLVTNWTQYVESFGGFVSGAFLPHSVYGYFQNGGSRCYVISVKTIGQAQVPVLSMDGNTHLLVRAKDAGYDGLNLRVSVAALAPPAPQPEGEGGEGGTAGESSFTVTVEREGKNGEWYPKEVIKGVTLVEEEVADQKQVRVQYANNRSPDLVDILIPPTSAPLAEIWPQNQDNLRLNMDQKQLAAASSQEFKGDESKREGIDGLAAIDDVTMVAIPDLMSKLPGQKELNMDMIKGVQAGLIAHCERMGDRVAILDSPPDLLPQEIKKWRMDIAGYDSSYAALYYPWIKVDDPIERRPVAIPPSGHVAGIWARNDSTRGVHKAPANEVVLGVTDLARNTSKGEQDILNPIGVNCIRAFPGRGIRVWGARTLSSDPSWRYLNIRRLFNYVEKSIEQGTQWVVFEPNDYSLWARVKRDISAFLRTVWRDGALFGLSPSEAFYVKCDEELNPSEVRDMGRLVIEVGISPVKPAEFVIFRISQWAGPGA